MKYTPLLDKIKKPNSYFYFSMFTRGLNYIKIKDVKTKIILCIYKFIKVIFNKFNKG